MRKTRIKRLGPFSYLRVKNGEKNFLSVWLTSHGDAAFGWEWGTDGVSFNPSLCVRIAHFDVLGYEGFKAGGYLLRVLGFWIMRP